jgi:hypothetical protein
MIKFRPIQNQEGGGKQGNKKDKKANMASLSDTGALMVGDSVLASGLGEKEKEDSFEKFYNKDLDLDEGKYLANY